MHSIIQHTMILLAMDRYTYKLKIRRLRLCVACRIINGKAVFTAVVHVGVVSSVEFAGFFSVTVAVLTCPRGGEISACGMYMMRVVVKGCRTYVRDPVVLRWKPEWVSDGTPASIRLLQSTKTGCLCLCVCLCLCLASQEEAREATS